MKRIKLFTIFNMPIYTDWFFVFFLIWIMLSSGWFNLFIIVSIFACVLAHEFGHSLTARKLGHHAPEIHLTFIGGLAKVNIPRNPKHEFLITIAGPLVNVVIGAIFFAILQIFNNGDVDVRTISFSNPSAKAYLTYMFLGNVLLIIFNIIPLFPMDGGRILRSLLAMKFDYLTATENAVSVSRVMCFIVGAYAIANGLYIMAFIVLFMWLAATAERDQVRQSTFFEM